jgi:hypothetical protein
MRLSNLFICLFLCQCCTLHAQREPEEKSVKNSEKEVYALHALDSYFFRRAYHGHDTLREEELDIFMNRNPEPCLDFSDSMKYPFHAKLIEAGLIKDGSLNIQALDTLPDQFNYRFSHTEFFEVNVRLLEIPRKVELPSFELTFTTQGTLILKDSLTFDWPPDVTFLKMDLDHDQKDELLTIYRWYIINGDNFDLKIYTLDKE